MFLTVKQARTREVLFRKPVELGESYTVGRSEDADIQMAHFSVSRNHGKFIIGRSPAEVWYEDLESANGSYLDGLFIDGRVLIEPGTEIAIGESQKVVLFHLKDFRDFKTPLKRVNENSLYGITSQSKDCDSENKKPHEITAKKGAKPDCPISATKELFKPKGLNMDALANKLKLFETSKSQNCAPKPAALHSGFVCLARERSRSREK